MGCSVVAAVPAVCALGLFGLIHRRLLWMGVWMGESSFPLQLYGSLKESVTMSNLQADVKNQQLLGAK